MVCQWCQEPLSPDDPWYDFPDGPLLHQACAMRQVIGSVAHLEQPCGCFIPGSTSGDPEGMTRRDAAKAAVHVFMQLGKQPEGNR